MSSEHSYEVGSPPQSPGAQREHTWWPATGLGERIVSYKIWKQGGLVVHASDPAIIGKRFPPSPELQAAWAGEVSGSFEALGDAESAREAALGLPLLEVYSPIHEVWSGRIIAVVRGEKEPAA